MSILGKLLGILVLVVVLLVVIGVSMYATDYAVEGTVEEKRCDLSQPLVVVDVRLFGKQEVEVRPDQCGILERDNFVVYHIRSQHTIIYEREGGRCLYDTQTGYGCGRPLSPFTG